MIICDYLILWLFDDYLHYLHYLHYLIINIEKHFIHTKMGKANDSPLFAFARLCCLKIPVVRYARLAKVTSDLLDSSLQGVPCVFGCRRWILYECKDENSPLQFMHLKFKNRSVCLLCVWLSAAHPPPQQVQCITLRLPLAMFTVVDWTARYSSKTRKRSAASVADFEEC